MKKLICSLSVAALMLTATATSFAAKSDYLPPKAPVSGSSEQTFFDLNADSYAAGSDITTVFTNELGKYSAFRGNNNASPIVVNDAEKGGSSVKVSTDAVWAGFRPYQLGTAEEGDKYCFELSLKSDSPDASIHWQYLDKGKKSASWIWSAGSTGFTFGDVEVDADITKWNNLVVEFEPGETDGTIRYYLNGELVATREDVAVATYERVQGDGGTPSNYATGASYSWYDNSYNRIQIGQFSKDADVSEYPWTIDDYRAWKSKTAYDPASAGDVVNLVTDLEVDGYEIIAKDLSTLGDLNAKLSASNNGTIVYLDANGNILSDMNAAYSDAAKIVVRSESGSVVKVYTFNDGIVSASYDIDNNAMKISGVLRLTTPEQLASKITSLKGYEVKVNASSKYVDNNSTVTVGEKTWSIELKKTYFDDSYSYDTASLNISNAGNTNYHRKGTSTVSIVSDTRKGSNVLSIVPPNALAHFDVNSSNIGIPVMGENETRIVEFSVMAKDKDTSFWISIYGRDPIWFTKEGKLILFDTVEWGDYIPGEWYHIVMAFKDNAYYPQKYPADPVQDHVKIWVNGEQAILGAAGGAYNIKQGNWNANTPRFSTNGANTSAIYIDDLKFYKAESFDYDADAIYGSIDVETDLDVVNNVIYLPSDYSFDEIYNDISFPETAVLLNADGSELEELDFEAPFYVRDASGVRLNKYSFAFYPETGIATDGSKIIAEVTGIAKEAPVLWVAAFDGNELLEVYKADTIVDGKLSIDVADIAYDNVTAFLWGQNQAPYVASKAFTRSDDLWN